MEYRYLKDINLIFSSQDHAHRTVNTFDIPMRPMRIGQRDKSDFVYNRICLHINFSYQDIGSFYILVFLCGHVLCCFNFIFAFFS